MTNSSVSKTLEERIAALEARSEIEDCIYRYCRGLDRMDVPLAQSAYHEDARDDYGFFVGRSHDHVEWANSAHETIFDSWQHHVTNISIDLDGDTAHVESYYIVAARRRSEPVSLAGGRYVDRFERRADRWAIAARICTMEWNTDAVSFEQVAGFNVHMARDPSDPSYARPLEVLREDAIKLPT